MLLNKDKKIIDDFFECFVWNIENIYDDSYQKQIELSITFLKDMYDMTITEFNINKKTSETFISTISKKIKNLYQFISEHNYSGDDVLKNIKHLYDYSLKTYITLRGNEYGIMFDKWINSGHISGGMSTKEKKEQEYKEKIFSPFLVDWKNGEYFNCKTYLDTIEQIKEINPVGTAMARRMYSEANKIIKRKATKKQCMVAS